VRGVSDDPREPAPTGPLSPASESGIDLDHAGMESLLRKFLDEAKTAQVALLFYAGHGLQVEGHNYLIPVDAKVESRS